MPTDVASESREFSAGGASAETVGTRPWLACHIGREQYLLDVSVVKEIIRIPKLTRVPRAPHWLKGICSLRGVVIAVIDAGNRLGLGSCQPTLKSRVVVLSTGKGAGGLLVDSVQGLLDVDLQQVDEPPALLAAPHREFIRGIVHRGQSAYTILDLDRLLTFPELSKAMVP